MEKLFWTPYKAHFGAFIAPGGRKSVKAGYYLHLEDGMSVLGGGIYRPPSDILKLLRQEIYYNINEFKTILEIFSAMYPFNAFLTRGME